MRKRVALSLAVTVVCLGAGAQVLAASGSDLAREGIELCREALFEKCVEKLSAAKATGGLGRDLLVDVNRYLGSAYLTLDRKDLAESAYRDLLGSDLSYELDPTTTNPEHLRFFHAVKEKVKKEKPRLPVKILHIPPERALPGQAVDVTFELEDPSGSAAKAVVYHRTEGGEYSRIVMAAAGGKWVATIPADAVAKPALEYYISVLDGGDNEIASYFAAAAPYRLGVGESSTSRNIAKTWWFWTVIGVVVAGAAAGIIYSVYTKEKVEVIVDICPPTGCAQD